MAPILLIGGELLTSIPLVIKSGIAGYFFGYYVTNQLIEEDFNKNKLDIFKIYETLFNLVDVAFSPEYKDKKIYIYYLYFLVLAQQNVLTSLIDLLQSGSFIEYYKNTIEEWNVEYEEIKLELENCLKRYLCYESFIKQIYGIPYDERNIFVIKDKFLTLEELSKDQLTKLQLFILNPLFNGWYDFTSKNIPVIKCYNVSIINKTICQSFVIDEFPIPKTINNSKEYSNHKVGIADIITPWKLHNLILTKKQFTQNLLDSWQGAIDSAMSTATGYKKSYTVSTGKKVNEMKDTAGAYYDDLKKELNSIRNSLNLGISDTTSSFTNTLIWGGLAIGAITLFSVLTRNGSEQ